MMNILGHSTEHRALDLSSSVLLFITKSKDLSPIWNNCIILVRHAKKLVSAFI